MSDVLARIRVRETEGIRRFLYPLSTVLDFPSSEMDVARLNLVTDIGEVVPCQWWDLNEGYEWLLEFAVSLAPFAELELALTTETEAVTVPDGLTISIHGGTLVTKQQRLSVEVGPGGMPQSVIYDGLAHLRGNGTIQRNGQALELNSAESLAKGHSLAASVFAEGKYLDGCSARTWTDVTSCKSWVTVLHHVDQPGPHDEVTFILPFAVTSPVLTCDFGIGGGTYGKLQQGTAEKVVWQTKFEGDDVQWSLATAGRTDYEGKSTRKAFRAQQWFHLIDSDKSLAVAMTDVPPSCQEMGVSLNVTGDIAITFRLGAVTDSAEGAEFGVCYHFLNDIPAIAAATNPQSILLPPAVEVLP